MQDGTAACCRALTLVPCAMLVDYGNCSLPHKESLVTTQWAPAMDGVIIPDIPADILAAGKAAHVPVLLGSNKNEGSTFLNNRVEQNNFDEFFTQYFGETSGPKIAYVSQTKYWSIEKPYPGADLKTRLCCSDHYRPPAPAPTPNQPPSRWGGMQYNSAAQDAAGDFDLRCPTVMAARHFANLGQPTYLYSFDHAPFESINWPGHTFHLGAFHGAEVPYVRFHSRSHTVPVAPKE